MILLELVSLQASLNISLDAIQAELRRCGLPPLSSSGIARHPLDEPAYHTSPKLYEARRLALGSSAIAITSFRASHASSPTATLVC